MTGLEKFVAFIVVLIIVVVAYILLIHKPEQPAVDPSTQTSTGSKPAVVVPVAVPNTTPATGAPAVATPVVATPKPVVVTFTADNVGSVLKNGVVQDGLKNAITGASVSNPFTGADPIKWEGMALPGDTITIRCKDLGGIGGAIFQVDWNGKRYVSNNASGNFTAVTTVYDNQGTTVVSQPTSTGILVWPLNYNKDVWGVWGPNQPGANMAADALWIWSTDPRCANGLSTWCSVDFSMKLP